MKEKTTKGTTETDQGLNEGNPNTERTPIEPLRQNTALVGGLAQGNFEDEEEGTTQKTRKESEDNASA